MKKNLILLFTAVVLFACKEKEVKKNVVEQTQKKELSFANKIEKAHQKDKFLSNDAIQFDTQISFGGNTILDAKISVATTSEYALIELNNGGKIYVDKDKVFVSPDLKDNPMVRFHAYTWSYFFLFPYKLSDNGTVWNNYATQHNSDDFTTQKLSFKANTGDAPDDWYIVYADKETNVLQQAAYIVTAGKTKEEAEKDPHAIKYENYQVFDGVPIATNWTFWGWSSAEGVTNQIGNASIKNVTFIPNFKNKIENIPSNYLEK